MNNNRMQERPRILLNFVISTNMFSPKVSLWFKKTMSKELKKVFMCAFWNTPGKGIDWKRACNNCLLWISILKSSWKVIKLCFVKFTAKILLLQEVEQETVIFHTNSKEDFYKYVMLIVISKLHITLKCFAFFNWPQSFLLND